MYLCRQVKFIVRNKLIVVSASMNSVEQAVRLEAQGKVNVLSLNTAWRQSTLFLMETPSHSANGLC